MTQTKHCIRMLRRRYQNLNHLNWIFFKNFYIKWSIVMSKNKFVDFIKKSIFFKLKMKFLETLRLRVVFGDKCVVKGIDKEPHGLNRPFFFKWNFVNPLPCSAQNVLCVVEIPNKDDEKIITRKGIRGGKVNSIIVHHFFPTSTIRLTELTRVVYSFIRQGISTSSKRRHNSFCEMDKRKVPFNFHNICREREYCTWFVCVNYFSRKWKREP